MLTMQLQDLTYCYIHMTKHDIQALSTIETDNYFSGELSDDGWCVQHESYFS